MPSHNIRPAGLGIVIVNTQVQPESKILIKAVLDDTSSVIMVEAAAFTLAAKILIALQVPKAHILSDNIVLLQFLSEQDRNHPPDWRMKTYIQHFDSAFQSSSFSIYKIDRNNNDEADLLARQALLYNLDHSQILHVECSFQAHGDQCTVLQALNNVSIPSLRILTPSCC